MATYTIIGGDEKQYNLVTEDNLRAWIAEGRLNQQSLIKAEGDAEFRPLAKFPEFAEALQAAKTVPTAQPSAPPTKTKTAAPAKMNGLAIASLALGIFGLFTSGITALIGLILGIVALGKVKKSRGALGGGGLALAGIIVSAIFVLLIPVSAAKRLSKRAANNPGKQAIKCISNVKELVSAAHLYADNNRGHYPAATNWGDALLRANAGLTNAFLCPLDFSGGRCSYAFNAQVSGAEVGKVNQATVVIFEAVSGWNLAGGPGLVPLRPRHGRIVVVGFADGHVEQVPEAQLPQLRWNP